MGNYRDRLKKVIPGGAHTYSRGDDQFPSNAPAIFEKGKGSYLWDTNNNKFLDYGMGLRSVNIGYANEEIIQSVYNEMLKGNNLTRASVTELEAAELLSYHIPSAEMVKFAKHGSTVTTAAVKLARAFTGRKYIAVPSEHPFFSFDDWFIGSTVVQKGVLTEISEYTLKFQYNDIASLKNLFAQYQNDIAAIILEPATSDSPCPNVCEKHVSCIGCPNKKNNFLHQAKQITNDNGALFILDEMITGFRWHSKGAQHFYDIVPDLSTFGKAMANGFAVAALSGRKEIMSMGSIDVEGKEKLFLTSTTHGAEMGPLGAFIETLNIIERDGVINQLWTFGAKLIDGINQISKMLSIENYFYLEGYPCSPVFVTKNLDFESSLSLRTLFAQEMIKKRVIMPFIALSASHDDLDLKVTLNAVESSLKVYKKALENGTREYLAGPIIKPVFRKFN